MQLATGVQTCLVLRLFWRKTQEDAFYPLRALERTPNFLSIGLFCAFQGSNLCYSSTFGLQAIPSQRLTCYLLCGAGFLTGALLGQSILRVVGFQR